MSTPFTLATPEGAPGAAAAETGLFLREDGSAGAVQHVDLFADSGAHLTSARREARDAVAEAPAADPPGAPAAHGRGPAASLARYDVRY